MRNRPEILGEATRYTDSNTLVPETNDKLRLLTLEVLVDIRDQIPVLSTLISRLLVERSPDP